MKMPERGRRHHSSDAYAEYRSKDRDHSSGSGRGRNQKPRHMDTSDITGDRRVKQNRQRDMTTVPHQEPHTYREYDHKVPSRL